MNQFRPMIEHRLKERHNGVCFEHFGSKFLVYYDEKLGQLVTNSRRENRVVRQDIGKHAEWFVDMIIDEVLVND